MLSDIWLKEQLDIFRILRLCSLAEVDDGINTTLTCGHEIHVHSQGLQ